MGNSCLPSAEETAAGSGRTGAAARVSDARLADMRLRPMVAPESLPAAPHGEPDPELFKAGRQKDFSFEGARYLAKVVDVYDGDTVRVLFRFNGELVQYRARMAGYDSPEMKPPKSKAGREAEKKAATAAREALLGKLGDGMVFVLCGPFDKYGRVLVTVYTRAGEQRTANGENINEWMVANGHGVPYDGGTKVPFST